jgi:dUTP pyrophosphatase
MSQTLAVPLERLAHGEGLDLPAYATPGSAGMDIPAAVVRTLVLVPGGRALVPTGFRLALPEGFEGQIRPRSGLALNHGITVLNAPGTIDSDYRGEVMVLLANVSQERFAVTRGLRIAQLVIAPFARARWQTGSRLPESGRGEGGFGSTGA